MFGLIHNRGTNQNPDFVRSSSAHITATSGSSSANLSFSIASSRERLFLWIYNSSTVANSHLFVRQGSVSGPLLFKVAPGGFFVTTAEVMNVVVVSPNVPYTWAQEVAHV